MKTGLLTILFFLNTVIANALDVEVTVGGDIQDAISQVAADGGGTVHLSSGTHIVSSTIKIKSNVVIRGAGMDSTIIKSDGPFTVINQAAYGQNNMSVFDLTVEGEPDVSCYGILIETLGDYHKNVTIKRVKVNYCGMGVHLKGIDTIYVDSCDFSMNGARGLEGYYHNFYIRRCHNVTIENSKFNYSPSANGFNSSYSENVIIRNCEAIGNSFRGFRSADSDGFTVENCIAAYNSGNGIVANTEKVVTKNINFNENCVMHNGGVGINAKYGATGSCTNNNSFSNGTNYDLPTTVTQTGNISDNSKLCTDLKANLPPVISITTLLNSEPFVAPADIEVAVEVSDADGSISKVEYYSGDTKIGEATEAPYTLSLSQVPKGNYSIYAVAYDNMGFYSSSAESYYSVAEEGTTEFTVNLTSIADGFIRGGTYSSSNYGTEEEMMIKNSSNDFTRMSFVRFDLSPVKGIVTSAVLKLHLNYLSANSYCSLYEMDNNTWTETGITWDNMPSKGKELVKLNISTSEAGKYVEFDLTDFVVSDSTGYKDVSLYVYDGLTKDATYTFSTKENKTNVPLLVVTYDTDPAIIEEVLDVIDFSQIDEQYEISPNPFTDKLEVTLKNEFEEGATIEIINLSGSKVYSQRVFGNSATLGLDQLSAGLYVVKIVCPDKLVATKVLKK